MSMGTVIATVFMAGLPIGPSLAILLALMALSIWVELRRLRDETFNQRVMKFFGPVMRSCEKDRLSGIPFYLGATIVAIAVFPKPVAVLSILYLAFGDPVASALGILYGDLGPRFKSGKSLVGTAAGVITCAVVSFFFLRAYGYPTEVVAVLTAVGGFVGGTVELLPLDTDDNFTIPVVSGFALWLCFIGLGL